MNESAASIRSTEDIGLRPFRRQRFPRFTNRPPSTTLPNVPSPAGTTYLPRVGGGWHKGDHRREWHFCGTNEHWSDLIRGWERGRVSKLYNALVRDIISLRRLPRFTRVDRGSGHPEFRISVMHIC